jgi:hypothetical protein
MPHPSDTVAYRAYGNARFSNGTEQGYEIVPKPAGWSLLAAGSLVLFGVRPRTRLTRAPCG